MNPLGSLSDIPSHRRGTRVRESLRGWNGHALRSARTAAGLTQEDLAGMAGCAHSGIARWESGQGAPSVTHAHAVAAALGLEVTAFVDFDSAETTLRDLRAWAGYTQGSVRQELALHRIGPIERGSMPLPPQILPRLAELYGVDEETLSAAAERTRAAWRALLESRRSRS